MKCGQIVSGPTAVTLKVDMREHLKKHGIEAKRQVMFEALPQVEEQAKKDASKILGSAIATVVDNWIDTNYVYVRVRSGSGNETVMQYDAVTKRLIGHST